MGWFDGPWGDSAGIARAGSWDDVARNAGFPTPKDYQQPGVGGGVAGLFGGVSGGDLFSLGGSLLSGWLNNSAANARQEDSQAFNAQQFATRYQTTVQDMKLAGLNPMLAYSQGGGSGASSSAASSAGYGDLGQVINQSKLATAQQANIQADTENKIAQSDNIKADTAVKLAQAPNVEADTDVKRVSVAKVLQDTSTSASQARLMDAQVHQVESAVQKISAEIRNIDMDTLLKETQGSQSRTYIKLMQATRAKVEEETKNIPLTGRQINALTAKIFAETKLVNADVKAMETMENIGREAGQLKPIFEMLRMFMPRSR